MSSLSIKAKVSAATVVCLGLGGVVLVGLFQASYQKNVAMVTGQSLQNARSTYENLVNADVQKMSAVAEMAMANPALRETFAARDRAKLIEQTQPVFDSLKKRYGVTIFNYIDDAEKRFLTMTDTKDTRLIGTKAVRFNVQECARTKTWVSGLALGQLGFALRTTHPFYDSGQLKGDKLLGYIELGSEIAGFVNTMKKQTGNDYGLIIRKQFLKEVDWKIQRERFNLPNNWDKQKDTVLGANTWKDEAIFAYDGDVTTLPNEGQVLDVIHASGTVFSRSVFPILDASGAKVGGIFVLVDISAVYHDLQNTKKATLATIGALILAICLVLILLLTVLVFRRLSAITNVATRLVGGDFQTPVKVSSGDEIGTFEQLFEQLRMVFVNLVEEHEKLSKKQD